MTVFLPNAVMSVFRDGVATTSTDAWGFTVDTASPSTSVADKVGMPAVVTERSKNVQNPGSGEITRVAYYVIRFRPKTFTFQETDRLLDTRTGLYYRVDKVSNTVGVVQATDIVLECTRVS